MTEQIEQQRQGPERKLSVSDPLPRTEAENREPEQTEETERAEAEAHIEGNKLVNTLATNTGDNAEVQNSKNRLVSKNFKMLRTCGPAHLADRARDVQLTINNNLIVPLQQEWKKVFKPEETKGGSAALKKEFLPAFGNPIKNMLSQASEGLVVIEGGRVCNRVGHAAGYMRELDIMLKDPLLRESATTNPQIKQQIRAVRAYITGVRRFFRGVLDGDPNWTAAMKQLKPERPVSADMRNGRMALHMLALLGASGMALISGLIDLKNKTPSAYTLAWLGIAGYTAGAFRGRHATIVKQLGFLPDAKWESLGITGEDGVRIFELIRNTKNKKRREARKQLLKNEITAQQYIDVVLGKDPQGDDKRIANKLQAIARKGRETFRMMVVNIAGVTDGAAVKLCKDMIGNGMNSQKAAAKLAEAQKAQREEAGKEPASPAPEKHPSH